MSGSDFRQITLGGDAPRRERLFRAAVSAFCSLMRPSRRDISQLEDLTLPLFESVSPESRRYVAAALSECRYPPPTLVKRLCDEPLEVAAPLLIRSTALADIDLLALVAEECAGYDVAPQGAPASVRGDPRLLRRLVRNLLENARRHGRPPIRVELRAEGATVVLDVIDSGSGVPEVERERVFVPFHRLGGDAKGAGLGLALVRQIARLHGGEAVVAPRLDVPACFRVTLPMMV